MAKAKFLVKGSNQRLEFCVAVIPSVDLYGREEDKIIRMYGEENSEIYLRVWWHNGKYVETVRLISRYIDTES